jgi:hypothetical protein
MTISYRTMKVSEHPRRMVYRTSCDCGSIDCDATIELEADTDANMLHLIIWKTLTIADFNYIYSDTFFRPLFWRIKTALKILFKGYASAEGELVFRGPEHIKPLISALEEGYEVVAKSVRRTDFESGQKGTTQVQS